MENKIITHAELIANIKISGCAYRWDYPVIKLDRAQIRTCCQVSPNEQINSQKIQRDGAEIFLNSQFLIDRKVEMLLGNKSPNCRACWIAEQDEFPSMRSKAQPLANFLEINEGQINHQAEYQESDLVKLAKISRPKILELQLDNICDLSCIYCKAEYSTTWEKKLGIKVSKPPQQEVDKFRELFWQWYSTIFSGLDGICIIGGEPLASPQFFPTLKKLTEIHSANKSQIINQQFLSITTNLNTRPEIFQRFLELLDGLKDYFNLSINGSCEAVGAKAEFIREGLDWNKFDRNARSLAAFIKKNQTPNYHRRIDFAIHAAQNTLSISSLPDLIKWAQGIESEFQIAVNFVQNIVTYPGHFAPAAVLPEHYAKYCDESAMQLKDHVEVAKYMVGYDWNDYSQFLSGIAHGLRTRGPGPDPEQSAAFREWYLELTEDRKTKFAANFPDLMNDIIIGTD